MSKNFPAQRQAARSVFLLMSAAGLLASGQTAPGNMAQPHAKKTDEAYKNIQVLKDLPADQLIPAMQFISSSLGVECSFCHTEGAFEKDDKKPKQTARKMMQMMFAINQANFEGKREVTCYSCHRGSPHPVATPMIAEAGASPAQEAAPLEPVPPSNTPAVEQILGKYVQAIGGASEIEKLSTRVEKGSIDISGRQFPVELFSKLPGKRVLIIHLPNGDNITALDGATGWISTPGRPTREIPAPEMVSAKLEADLRLPIHFQQFFSEIKTTHPEKIDDHEVYVVSGGGDGRDSREILFR